MDCAECGAAIINLGQRGLGGNPTALLGGRVCCCQMMLLPMSQGACASLSARGLLQGGIPSSQAQVQAGSTQLPSPPLSALQILYVSLTLFPHADLP